MRHDGGTPNDVLVGTSYWAGLLDWMRDTVLATDRVDPVDADLLHVTDDADEVVNIVEAGHDAQRAVGCAWVAGQTEVRW